MKRIILAFLLAPISPIIILLPFALINQPMVFLIASFIALFAYLATIVFGIPLFLFLRLKPHLQQASIYVPLGMLIGIVAPLTFVVILAINGERHAFDGVYNFWFISAPYGAISSAVFWQIARKPILINAQKRMQESPSHA